MFTPTLVNLDTQTLTPLVREEMADMFHVLRAYLIDCADEARRLLASRAVPLDSH